MKYVSLVDLFRVFVLRMNMPQACRARRRRVNGVREILWHYRENPAPNPFDINWLAKFVAKYDRDSAKDGLRASSSPSYAPRWRTVSAMAGSRTVSAWLSPDAASAIAAIRSGSGGSDRNPRAQSLIARTAASGAAGDDGNRHALGGQLAGLEWRPTPLHPLSHDLGAKFGRSTSLTYSRGRPGMINNKQ